MSHPLGDDKQERTGMLQPRQGVTARASAAWHLTL